MLPVTAFFVTFRQRPLGCKMKLFGLHPFTRIAVAVGVVVTWE